MPYVRNEEAMFDTGDEELFESLLDDDQEKWEEEAAPPRYRRGAVPLGIQRKPFQPIAGASGARIQTPAGMAQVQFPKPVATQEAVNALARELKGEIASLAAAVKKVNQTLDSNTAIVDKKVNTVSATLKKSQEQSQMMMMLPLLLNQAPTLTKLTLQPRVVTGTAPPPVDFTVVSQEVKKDNSSTLLLVLMMTMMGGDSNMSNMLPMMLLLGGGL